MIYKIKKTTDPILRKETEKITDFDMETQELIDNMIETMRKSNGIGLAAPQIGISKKIVVLEFENDDKESKLKSFPLTILCNPEIIEISKEEKNMVEGCLSFPGLELLVKRPKRVRVRAQDRYGNHLEIDDSNLLARVMQHEIDHLNSTLLIDHLQKTDIIYIGTGTLGLPALELLSQDPQYNVKLVITGIVKASGRKKSVVINPIEELAKKKKLPMLLTNNINDAEVINKIKDTKPTLGIMADFGQIVSTEVLDTPTHGIINIHPSLLPKHRGPSPIQQTILDGDKQTGVTLILAGEKMDAGSIISQVLVKLRGTETTSILKEYLSEVGANLLLNSIPYYLSGDLSPIPQDESKASYNKLFRKEDGFVDKNTPKTIIERKIRAFSEWPKVYTLVNGRRVQLLSSHINQNDRLVIDVVKPEGKSKMRYEDFKRGYRVEIDI